MLINLQNITDENQSTYFALRRYLRKKHRLEKSQEFLSKCENDRIFPKFTKLSENVIKQAKLRRKEINLRQQENLHKAFNFNCYKLKSIVKIINQLRSKLNNEIGSTHSKRLHASAVNFVINCEKPNDTKRDLKLKKLLSSFEYKTDRITIYDEARIELPPDIIEILSQGLDRPIGGSPNKDLNTCKHL